MLISTGNSISPIDQLLATVRALVAKPPAASPPPPSQPAACLWYAVCWDFDECAFNMATLRQEPDRGDDPALFPCPLLFPWVYLPSAPTLPTPSPASISPVHAAVRYLNQYCHWQKDTEQIADIVHKLGGQLIRHATGGLRLGLAQTLTQPRFRESTTIRVRSQPQRYTRSRRRSDQLAALADSRYYLSRYPARSALRDAVKQTRTIRPYPLPEDPVPPVFTPGHKLRGETEEVFRQRVGLETFAEQVCCAISKKWEQELRDA